MASGVEIFGFAAPGGFEERVYFVLNFHSEGAPMPVPGPVIPVAAPCSRGRVHYSAKAPVYFADLSKIVPQAAKLSDRHRGGGKLFAKRFCVALAPSASRQFFSIRQCA